MTKQEWLDDLNQFIGQITNNRKKQLFALACCRSVEHLITDQRSKDCLEKIELFIDGKIEELESARLAAAKATRWAAWAVWWAANANPSVKTVYAVANAASRAKAATAMVSRASYAVAVEVEQTKQLEFLKDIYNPFLIPLTFPQKAIQLAEEVYDTNNPITRLILSDFLEEHHFPEELYLHLKQPNHYKGCWVIDQILNKL